MVIGHQKQLKYLNRLAELKKIPHALLFSGPGKVGKKTVALEFAKSLIGEKEQHPDLIFLEPEAGKDEIKINQIRELIWKLSLKPYSAPFKIAIIDQADKMTKESQNCFLKTLEDPKDKTLLILIAEHPKNLLATILSRCQTIKFYPVKRSEIENYLKEKKINQKDLEEILDLASGLPGKAIEICLEPEKLAEIKNISLELQEAMKGDLAYRFQLAKILSERESLGETLEIWQNYLRKDLFSKKNAAILAQIQNISYLIESTQINQRLALETLMLEI